MPTRIAKGKRRLPRWSKLLLAVAASIVLGAWGLYGLGFAATARWERYAAELRAAGEPLTFAEIEEQRGDFPEEGTLACAIQDLAEDLDQIGESLRDTDEAVWIFGDECGNPDFFVEEVSGHLKPSREFLERHRGMLNAVHIAADLPPDGFAFPVDLGTLAVSEMLPSLNPWRLASKLLMLEAQLKMVDGDFPAAAENVEMMSRISATLDTYPTVIGRLVQIANDALIVQTIENLLRAGELDDQDLKSLGDSVDSRLDAATMKWAFLGERAFFAGTCDEFADGKWTPAAQAGSSGPQRLDGISEIFIRKNQILGVEMLTWLVDGADDPKAMRQATARIEREKLSKSWGNSLAIKLIPTLSRTVILHLQRESELKCTIVALAAERYRLSAGRLPESLDQLASDHLAAIPTDPFDGQPMRFATTDEGIVIYSISGNDVDDGGIVTEQDSRPKYLDIGFRLNDPEHRGLAFSDEPPPEGE